MNHIFAPGRLTRLRTLKLRTLLVAALAIACLAAGVDLGVAAVSLVQGAVPLDTPDFVLYTPPFHMLHRQTLAFWLLAICAFSTMQVARLKALAIVVFALFMATLTVLSTDPSARLMGVMPSRLEWAVMRGNDGQARDLLDLSALPKTEKQYLHAQIDLHSGVAWRASAATVLALSENLSAPPYRSRPVSERLVPSSAAIPEIRAAMQEDPQAALLKYGAEAVQLADPQRSFGNLLPPPDPLQNQGALLAAQRFSPEVLHALDVAHNGVPRTRAAARWEQAHPGRARTRQSGVAAHWLRVGLAGMLLAAAMAAAALWWRMLARIRAIHASGKEHGP